MGKERNISLDIAKGIGIILIVFGHIRNSDSNPVLLNAISFVYYFHVTLFFFISGYFSSPNRSFSEYVRKKVKQLLIPYLWANLILYIVESFVHLLIIRDGIVNTGFVYFLRTLLGIEPVNLAGPTWFMMSLFWVGIAYWIIYHLCKNNELHTLICSFIIAILGYTLQVVFNFYGVVFIARTCIIISLYALGHYFKIKGYLDRITRKTNGAIISFIVSLIILICFYFIINYRVNFFWQRGDNLLYFYITGLSGTIMIISLSHIISNIIKEVVFLSYCGAGSLWILIGHYVVFLLINLLQLALTKASDYSGLNLICYNSNNGWWIVYLFLGTLIPLTLKSVLFTRDHNITRKR